MLNQVVVPRAVFSDVRYHFAHNVELMITRENQSPVLHADKFLQDVKHTVLLQDALPKISGRVAVRIGRIALAAVTPCTVTALVERQKNCVLARKFRRQPNLKMIDGEISKNAPVELEADFARVTVEHPLPLCIFDGLPRVLILQLERKDGDAVERKHHVDTAIVVRAVMPLPITRHVIFGILSRRQLI